MILSQSEYRRLSGDYDSYDGDVLSTIADAQIELENITDRKFERATYTETVTVVEGYVLPRATPLVSVSVPSDGKIDGSRISVGDGYNGWYWNELGDQTSITYVGGYTAETMPTQLKKLLTRMTFEALHIVRIEDVPVGATSVRVGDIAITGRNLTSVVSILTPSILAEIRRWRKAGVNE